MRKIRVFSFILYMSLIPQLSAHSQDILSIIKDYDNKIREESTLEFKLVLISSSECGYCQIAYKKIENLNKELQIIVIDYGTHEGRKQDQLKYGYIFLDGNEINGLGHQDSFPKLFLYNKEDELIWRKNGWVNKNLQKIESKIKSH